MGRLGEVALLLTLFLLLGTRAQYNGPWDDFEDYDEHEYDFVEDEDIEEEDFEEEDADAGAEPETADEGGEPPMAGPQNQKFTPLCNYEYCWIKVDWEPPPRDTWMSCILGYRVGFRQPGNKWDWINDEGTHIDQRSDKLFFFEEAEGTKHSLTINWLDFEDTFEVIIEVFNPYGRTPWGNWHEVVTPPEPCREAFVLHPDKFLESSENSISVHLNGWQDANCPTVNFIVVQREQGKEEWSFVSRSAKPGADILISNLSPATWYHIQVLGEVQRSSSEPSDTSLAFEIATLAPDGSRFSGCVIEKFVKYSGNNLSSKRGINQETCALLCFKKTSCTHWTHNLTYQGGKCWLKTSSSGRTKSTTGSTSGQKACGSRGFSLPEVTKAAATAVAECQSPWTSLDIPGQPSGCYLFHGFKSSWYDSKMECKQSGGHLVEIGSREEQEALIGELERQGLMGYDAPVYGFWIGLTDIFHDGTWVWDHQGQPLNFSAWASLEPNNERGVQHCVAMNIRRERGKWDDVGCEYEGNNGEFDSNGHICEADTGSTSMTYTKEHNQKWENENGKTSHMKVLMVHDEEECEKECTATVPCIAFTFIPGMEICALKAPKDAVTMVPSVGATISGRLDGERPSVHGKELDSTICLSCLPECNVEKGTKLSGHNLYPLGAETQEECSVACLREPECHFWTHNPNIGRCWLKKSDLGREPSTKGSNSGQKSCGVTEEDILTGHILESNCTCSSGCAIEEQMDYRGNNIGQAKWVENQEACAKLSASNERALYWTFMPPTDHRWSNLCWIKTSNAGRMAMSTVVSGNRECGIEYCGVEANTKYSGHNLYTRKGIKVGNMAGCANLCFKDNKCKFWTFNPRVSKCWMKTSNEGKSPSDKGSFSGQKACGAPGALPEEPESLPTSGLLQSPNYPSNYHNDLHERKTIRVAEGNVINIHFTDFELERPDQVDYVELTDGDGTLLGHFASMDHIKENITSNTETVFVLFHTDGSVTQRGWSLEWSASEPREDQPTSGVMTSPNYPEKYPNDVHLTRTIVVPKGNIIAMQLTHFALEREHDYVVITDGDPSRHREEDRTRLAKFHGGSSDWKYEIVSRTETVVVTFVTDGSVTDDGWRLEWGMLTQPGGEARPASGYTGIQVPEEYRSGDSSGKPQPGLLLSGGNNYDGGRFGPKYALSNLEMFAESGQPNCSIPDLPIGRTHHTMSVLNKNTLVVCGGIWTRDTCISWTRGSAHNAWEIFATLSPARARAVTYSSQDKVFVMGGDTDSSSDTGVELVAGPISSLREWRFYQGRAFNLRHSANRACLIPGKDFFIITGGKNSAHVDRYLSTGEFDLELPGLRYPRWNHACSSYTDQNNQLVLLVTGGMHGGTAVDTTELLLLGASHWIKGPPQWISGPRLPRRVNGVRAINSGGEIFLFGGNDDSEEYLHEIFKFNEDNQSWDVVGRLEQVRGYHALIDVDFSHLCG